MRNRSTPSALNDFKTISRPIEQERNLATANRACRHIYDAIQDLQRHPHHRQAWHSKWERGNL